MSIQNRSMRSLIGLTRAHGLNIWRCRCCSGAYVNGEWVSLEGRAESGVATVVSRG